MTGLECLKEELLAKGYTKAQTESKVVIGVLEVLANDKTGIYKDLEKASRDHEAMRLAVSEKRRIVSMYEDSLKHMTESFNEQCTERIEKFYEILGNAETPEGRDAIRIAQMFINSVDVDTKYDNTAFIIGLASILSRWNTGPMDELRKINTKIPNVNPYTGCIHECIRG